MWMYSLLFCANRHFGKHTETRAWFVSWQTPLRVGDTN